MSKIALVLGGAGNIGGASVRAFLQEGCFKQVVITSRTQDRIDKAKEGIKASLGDEAAAKVSGVVGDTANETSLPDFLNKVKSITGDKIDVVVSVMGFPFANYGPLLNVSTEQTQTVFGSQFYPAFGAYKTFYPLVKNANGTYITITGGGPDMYLGPGTAVMTLGGSLSTALAKVIMKEHGQDGTYISEVSFNAGVCPDPSVMPPGYTWLPSADAGKAIVSVATKKVSGGKSIVIKTPKDLQQVITSGALEQTNGVA